MQVRADIAASFQRVAIEQIQHRVERAIAWVREVEPDVSTLVIAGGVACNTELRMCLDAVAASAGLVTVYPPVRLCTDNGAYGADSSHWFFSVPAKYIAYLQRIPCTTLHRQET